VEVECRASGLGWTGAGSKGKLKETVKTLYFYERNSAVLVL
jgi:hypothetical protein